jgi:hypothetical protein
MKLPRRRLPYVIACVALLLAAAVFYATRPAATVAAIQRAVATKDYVALNDLVDFPMLRASVKSAMLRDLEARAADPSSFGARLGAALGNLVAGPVVDLVVSPLGLAFILEGYSPREAARGAQSDSAGAPAARGDIVYRTHWESLSRYAVDIEQDGKRVSVLILQRYGIFHWKLAGVDLAPAAPEPAQSAPGRER